MKPLYLVLLVDLAVAAAQIFISPNCSSSSSSCVTINELLFPAEGDISLVFSPGTHRLEGALAIQDRPRPNKISLVGTLEETTIECIPSSSSYILTVEEVNSLSIANITFSGCTTVELQSDRINITRSKFTNTAQGSLVISNSSAVHIDQATFNNNSRRSSYETVLEVTNSEDIKITRSIFTGNVVAAYSSIVLINNVTGSVSSSTFHNNSVGFEERLSKLKGRVQYTCLAQLSLKMWDPILQPK